MHPVSNKTLILQTERRFYPITEVNKKDIYLFVPESITNSSEISNYSIGVFCVLQALNSHTFQEHCISHNQIYYYLFSNTKPTRYTLNYIKCGLEELIQNGYISKTGEFQKNYIIDCSNLWVNTEKEKFTIITFKEVKEIFQVKNTNNFLLLKYFIFLIGTLSSSIEVFLDACQSKNRVVGNLTVEYISQKSGISERSIIEYNKILENIGLIYISRQNDFVIDENNEIRQLSNVYGRPCDKLYIDAFASNQQKHRSSYRYVQKSVTKVNSNRKFAQMYNHLIARSNNKEEIKYSDAEIQDIYDYVISENRKYELLYEKTKYEEHLNKIRNTDVFQIFDFIKIKRSENDEI